MGSIADALPGSPDVDMSQPQQDTPGENETSANDTGPAQPPADPQPAPA